MLSRREQPICPHCGQRMLVRHGVRLSPLLADLFDIIARSGESGIAASVLADIFYPGKPTDGARNCIRQNVRWINERLVETDVSITGDGPTMRGFYRIR
jgi:hypothetical protein